MKLREYKTDGRLWLAASLVVAVALGFVPLLPSGKGNPPSVWEQIFSGRENVGTLVCDLFLVVVEAVLGGWLLQSFVCIGRGRLKSNDAESESPKRPDSRGYGVLKPSSG
jgi:hypothetical protein